MDHYSEQDISLGVAVVVSAIAAWTDLRTGHIPNVVTLGPLGLAPLVYFAFAGATKSFSEAAIAAGLSIFGAVVCSLVPLILFRIDAMGGGDVKLLTALGAIAGIRVGIEAQFYSFMVAAILAPARLVWEGKLLRVLGNTAAIALNPFLPKARRRELAPEMLTKIRFGPAILAGTLIAVLLQL